MRIVSSNLGCIGVTADDPRNSDLFSAIKKFRADITLLQELGNNWSVQSERNNWWSRVQNDLGKRHTRTRCSHNIHDAVHDRLQWGGTGVIAHGAMANHSIGSGSDKSGLGRWTWARISGKLGNVLRYVSIYRPSRDSEVGLKVSAQHINYFREHNDDRHARQAFLEDLEQEIREWLDAGDHIVIGGDINESVFSHKTTSLFDQLNFRNLMFDRHNPDEAPATCIKNKSGEVIDGLWGTPMVHVVRCGFIESGEFPGDHATLWADVSLSSVLGYIPQRLSPTIPRRLRLNDPTAVKRYHKVYNRLVTESKLCKKAASLEASIIPGTPLSRFQMRAAEEIDGLRTKCMLKAEKCCRKLRMGKVEFSLATEIPRRQMCFWRLALRRRKGISISPKLWHRKKSAAEITINTRNLSLQQMEDLFKEACNNYKQAKRDSWNLRRKFLESVPAKERKRLKQREEMTRLGRLAGSITGKRGDNSVMKVIDAQGREHYTKEDIDAAILPVNEAKYRASESTPFLQELFDDFGYQGHSLAVDEVLAGRFIPTSPISSETRAFINAMQMSQSTISSHHHIRPSVSIEDHVKGWQKAKERTMSGISGLHFGMFKLQARVPKLAKLDASLRNIAYSTGYVYERWCQGVDVQILKKKKDRRINKLRTILLLEADFNMNNKQLGRDLMWKAEQDKSLASDNYGGRKNYRAVEVSLNSTLTSNSIWARRGRAIILSNDAKGCFDRIAHQVAYICLLRLGAPRTPLLSMIRTIQRLRHCVRTAFGDSEITYGGDSDIPLQGLLQGNGMAPPGWSAVGSVLVQAMTNAGFGYNQWSTISRRAIQITCFAFVDDTDLIHAIDPDAPTSQLIQEAQHALTLWEGMLKASGGALAPEKSFWYLVEVIRRNGSWQYKRSDPNDQDIFLQSPNEDGTQVASQRLNCDDDREALGIFKGPSGSMKTQVKEMRKKVRLYCDAIRTKRMAKNDAWYCFNSTILRSLEYPLMATTLSKSQLASIMSPLLQAVLPQCGLQRNFPRKLLYGSPASQGCNFKDPWIIQLVEHLLVIVRHGNWDTPTSDLLMENMELVQTHVGSSIPFWSIPHSEAGFLAPQGWIAHTWEAMEDLSIEIRGPMPVIPSNREGDIHIMDAVRECGIYGQKQMLSINNCRMYMGVTCLSDITSADGTSISAAMWSGNQHFAKQHNPHSWPGTYRPSRSEWERWRHMLSHCFVVPHNLHRRLRNPLGKWMSVEKSQWRWWFDPSQESVWEFTKDGWSLWGSSVRNSNVYIPSPLPPQVLYCEPSPLAFRVDVRSTRNGREVRITNQDRSSVPADYVCPASIFDALRLLPESTHWAIDSLSAPDDGASIIHALSNGSAVAVSDGSLKSGLGTSAFVIEGADSTNCMIGVNQVPGPINDGDSYRCELAGIYATILVCTTTAKYFHLIQGECTFACDNEAALQVFTPDFSPNPSSASYDLVVSIHKLLATSPIRWHAVHVKGHQDRRGNALTRIEQMNVQMDSLAKLFWYRQHLDDSGDSPRCNDKLSDDWGLWSNGNKITHPSRNNLYAILQDPVTIDWWVRHNRISRVAVDLIDWHSNGKALRKTPLSIQRWNVKHASNNCGCGVTLLAWNKQSDDRCPRCQLSEDSDHVIQCTGEGADKEWQESITRLTIKMNDLDTDPDLRDMMLQGIHAWRQSGQFNVTDEKSDIREIIHEQNTIGWRNFLDGLWSKLWCTLQQRHYNKIGSRRTGKKWMYIISNLLRRAALKQWLHRNAVKHRLQRPRHKRQTIQLNHHVIQEFQLGPAQLPESDRRHFNTNIVNLIKRPLKYKQAWLSNVTHARQRAARKRSRDNQLSIISRKRSRLLEWAKTGRAS